MTTVAFIGLGVMGKLMAANLQKKFKVRSFDINGSGNCKSAQEAAWGADVLITMVPDGKAVRSAVQAALPGLAPGTIVVDTADRYLYLIQGNNRAMRYGIGVGREGFQWQGLLKITRKAEWPDWTPPPEMIQRQPYLPRFMAGGPGNPMGARALYLGATIYRIHGTNQPQTIGSAVSSGCFRLVNGDVIDLYGRVPVGTKVVVRQRPTL